MDWSLGVECWSEVWNLIAKITLKLYYFKTLGCLNSLVGNAVVLFQLYVFTGPGSIVGTKTLHHP